MADLILGKQERLAKMREQKRKRDADKKAKQDALMGGSSASLFGTDGKSNISNAFIDSILRDEDPFTANLESKDAPVLVNNSGKDPLKVSSYVIDM